MGTRIVIAALLLLAGCAQATPPADLAARACEGFVSDRLKAPATADFTGTVAAPDGAASNSWKASGMVDAENSFGAKIRSTFTCYLHTEGEDWVLESVQGLD